MSNTKKVRWECPHGQHPGVLGSTRPRKESIVRYCLPCSESAGVLVQRTAPALERKRAQKTAVRQTKAERERERAKEAKANALKVPVLDAAGEEFILDAGELLREAWDSRELRRARGTLVRWRSVRPSLVIRRGQPDKGRAALSQRSTNPIRHRDTLSGHAKTYGDEIVLTAAPGLGHEWLRAIVIHEAAHMACPDSHHGSSWRTAYWRTVAELYDLPMGTVRLTGQAAWKLDEQIAEVLR